MARSSRTSGRWSILGTLLIAGAAQLGLHPVTLLSADAPALTPKEIYAHTVKGTVWVQCPEIRPGIIGLGSGWVLDKQRKLVVTNHHVIRGAKKIEVIFPEFEENRPITDKAHYMKESPRFAAKVFLDDSKRDLAILKLTSISADAVALELADEPTSPGEMIFSVGNATATGNTLWAFVSGSVRAVGRERIVFESGQEIEAMMVKTQSPTNPGDSGGPVVNDRGQVIGVVSSEKTNARDVSNFIDLSEIVALRKEIDDLWAPKTAEQFYRRGQNYQKQKDWTAAIADFNSALKLKKEYAEAMAQRGQCFFEQEDFDTARLDFDEAIKLDSQCISARLGHLYLSRREKKFDDVIADATQIIRLDPSHAEAYALRSSARFNKDEVPVGYKDIVKATELAPNNSRYFTMRAENEIRLNDTAAALKSFNTAINLDPLNEIAISEMTTVLINAGRAQEAITLSSNLIAANNRNVYALAARARSELTLHRFFEARRDATTAVEALPRADLFSLRGKAQLEMNEPELALNDFRQAVKLAPQSVSAHTDLAEAALKFNKYDEAMTECDAAIRLNPKLASAYITRAMARFGINESASGIQEDVDRAKELDKDYENAKIARRTSRHLVVINDTNENIEFSFHYYAPGVDDRMYWYPGDPADTPPIVSKLAPHSNNTLVFRGKAVDAVSFRYSAKSLDSSVVWVRNKDEPINIVRDNSYISWRTENYYYRLFINPAK